MKKEYLECGKVCSAHGVRGEIKIEPWCDSPKVLTKQKRIFLLEKNGNYKEVGVEAASVFTKFVIMKLSGIDTRETAQAEKNRVLYLNRADIPIPRGAHLIADMIGLPVIHIDTGVTLGVLTDVDDGVRHKLYTVRTEKGDVLLPGISEFIKEIDTERGIFVRPISGFFDDD